VQRLLGAGGLSRAVVSFRDGTVVVEGVKLSGSRRFSSTPSALLHAAGSFGSGVGGSFGGGFGGGGGFSGSFLGSRTGSREAPTPVPMASARPLLPSDDPEALDELAETDAQLNELLRKKSSALVLAA